MSFINVIIFIILILIGAYLWIEKRYKYWKDRDIPYVEPSFPYGTLKASKNREHSSLTNAKYYKQFKGTAPFVGLFFTIQPAILTINKDFIKNILIKDFQYFHDRGTYFNEKSDPLSGHIFNLDGPKWRALRAKLTPTFTSGKMKNMFSIMAGVGQEFISVLREEIKIGSEIEMKEFLARFTTDIIGNCAFGLECNSLKDPNAKFRDMGRKVFDSPRNGRFKLFLILSFKQAARFFNTKTVRDDVSEFFMKVVKDTVSYREKNMIVRNDFMDLLLKLKNSENPEERLTMNEIAAQAFVFFLAGFETSSTTMSYALYELALNQDIQDKARKCVEDVLKKHDGQFTYESVNEMAYIDHCINESLRKYPPGANIIRVATKDYHVPEVKYTIKKDTLVMVPVYAIHHDPEFYPNPEKYMPERFEPEIATQRDPITFIPFGEGPRICIGLRFGMLQARLGLALLLKHFKFTLSPKTQVPLKFSATNIVLTPESGLHMNLEKLD